MTDDVRQLYSIRTSDAITVTNICQKHMFLSKLSEIHNGEQRGVENIRSLFKTADTSLRI